MKHVLLALVLVVVSLSTFADPGRGHGRGHRGGWGHGGGYNPGHYRPMPGPGHYRPGPVIVIRPRYPMPMPGRNCRAVMVDRFDRVVRQYWGYESYGMCRSALRDCNWDIQRMGAWGYRCSTAW